MTKVHVTCGACGAEIITNMSGRDFDISTHFEMFHPVLFEEACKYAREIERNKEAIYELTGVRNERAFPTRRIKR